MTNPEQQAEAASLPPIDLDGSEVDSYVLSEREIANLPETEIVNRPGSETGFGTDTNNSAAGDTDGPEAQDSMETSFAYYAYSGAELALIEAVIYHNESHAGDRHQRFYSTVYTGQLNEYGYEYGEKPAPEVYYEITSEKAEEIIAEYVYEHPRFTPFVEP